MKRFMFRVSLVPPAGVRADVVKAFIEEALRVAAGNLREPGWAGPGDKGDPMYGFDQSSIRVSWVQP